MGSLAASTSASLHRQIGRHRHARGLDEYALALVTPFTENAREATLDALTGLAADAVGVADIRTATARREQASEYLTEELWRANVRIRWVRAEIALLRGDPAGAKPHASEAVELATASGSARHLAKSLLFLGVCEKELGISSTSLQDSIALAEGIEALPLLWPAYSVLGENSKAAEVIEVIAADLPVALREEWLSAPDIARVRTKDPS